MTQRLFVAVAGALLVVSACSVGHCATSRKAPAKKTPAAKAPAKAAPKTAEVKLVEKTVGRFTLSVPSDWKQMKEDGAADYECIWYLGSDVEKPKAGVRLDWNGNELDSQLASTDVFHKIGPCKIAGVAAVEYSIKSGQDVGIAVLADSAEADGSRLSFSAVSSTGEWKTYEPIIRKILSSIKIKLAEPTKTSAEVKWVERTVGRVTFSVPEDWKREEREGGLEVWYTGRRFREAGVFCSVEFRPQFREWMAEDPTAKKIGAAKIGDVAATEYLIDHVMRMYVADKPEADGTSLVVTVYSENGWSAYEATCRKILASVKIKPDKPTAPAGAEKSFGRGRITLPGDWKAREPIGTVNYSWYTGADEEKPDCFLAVDWNTITADDLATAGYQEMKKIGATSVSGIQATEYSVKFGTQEGTIILADDFEKDGTHLAVTMGSATGEWKKYEPVARKILASIKIKLADSKEAKQ